MPLLTSSGSYLGVDIDNHSIKMVELGIDKGRPRLITYGFFDHDLDKKVKDGQNTTHETAQLLEEIKKKAKMKSNVAISALPAYSVFSSVITMPEMSRKELASAIKWEAKKVIPLPLDDMNLHWDILADPNDEDGKEKKNILGFLKKDKDKDKDKEKHHEEDDESKGTKIKRKKGSKSVKVLLTAAPKNLVKKFINIYKDSGITLLSLDTESFALSRSLVGNDPSTVMIVDIDFSVSNIMIIQGGIPYLNRSINVGGLTVTKAIADSLNINMKRAEQFKYDIGLGDFRGGGEIPATVKTAIQPIIDEIKYSLNLYKGNDKPNIEKIVLTGGSSLLKNLPNYLSETLQMKVFLGDPWARVIYPRELKPILDEIGPRFSVAVGLAMKLIK